MGTVVGTVEDCREMFEDSAQTRITPFSLTNQIGNPVAYKLVRVAGDGSLVLATDEEILEVNETDMHIASNACQTVGYLPAEELPSLLSQPEISEALNSSLLLPDNVQPCTDQYTEGMLQKVEQEEMHGNVHGSQVPSTPPDGNIQCSNEKNLLEEDQVRHVQETIPVLSDVQNGCHMNESDKIEPCSNAEASPKETTLSAAAQNPDFSRVRGEICLDDLPIKALQETFRATFGRETTVKDKTWLKRRIAMGLVNSCDVPTTSLTIKDNKFVGNQEKSNDVIDVSKDTGDDLRATNSRNAPSGTDHVNGNSNAYGHILGGNHYYASEDYSSEQRDAKRVRKPTRRYIEELSETDDKQQNNKAMIHSKDQRLSEKSEVRSISVSSGKRVAVTRMVSLAGSEIEVPYVSHVRRSRPRENIMALMDCHSSCLEDKTSAAEANPNLSSSQLSSEVVNRESVVKSVTRVVQKEFVLATSHNNNEEHILTEVDQDMGEPEHIDSSGNSSDDTNNNGVPVMQGGVLRRKHHRAWTLSEVTKLVEGVSKYGAGKWSEIKKHSFSSYSYRTSVDLKDKWRNLLKASFAQSPSNNTGILKKHGSMHIPMQILFRVRELAEKQSPVPPLNKVVGDSNRKENESRSDVL